jgi:hypothetical protein
MPRDVYRLSMSPTLDPRSLINSTLTRSIAILPSYLWLNDAKLGGKLIGNAEWIVYVQV